MLLTVKRNNQVLNQYTVTATANIKAPDYEHYEGVYDVVPDIELQTLETENKYVAQDITVQPIPDEYQDITETTAMVADVRDGKYFYNAQGEFVEGTINDYIGDYDFYPGSQTFIANTKNRYMTDDITVYAIPSNYTNVSDTTATRNDVLAGKRFHLASGESVLGNIQREMMYDPITPTRSQQTFATGGKFVERDVVVNAIPSAFKDSESGTWSPSSDVQHGSITLSNTHTKPPAFFIVADKGTDVSPNDSGLSCIFIDYQQLADTPLVASNTQSRYATVYENTRNSSGAASINYAQCTHGYTDPASTDDTYSRYFATETELKPDTGNASRYWLSARQYKWIAIWI